MSASTKGAVDPAAGDRPGLLEGALSLPAAVLRDDALRHNLRWMQAFADRHGVRLAPHGKTTMSPRLFHEQVEAGAWAITLATAPQVAAAAAHGIPRVLMANQLVGERNMAVVADAIAGGMDVYCLVDSVANVEALARFFSARGQVLQVLVEIGIAGARCGCRSVDAVRDVVAAVRAAPPLRLRGIETYEGVVHAETPAAAATEVTAHLRRVRDIAHVLLDEAAFDEGEVLLSGAGSAWYDLVTGVFTESPRDRVVPVIRPGCYLIHDHGLCMHGQAQVMARSSDAMGMVGDLRQALEVWAHVQSIPEPGHAIVGMGKRDVAFDAGLPVPLRHHRPGREGGPREAGADWQVVSMMDQHAVMRFDAGADLRIGDMLGFGTSHPCLTFDKWTQLHRVDDDYRVIDTLRTCF
ncbi:amino acid deaminase [Lysobacter sp. SG-8]|uniref:Amino acid deaminase n=1 Tax=Marilutibacter penaei TaxID=2759900 RepID=A0A7W3U154_9GAMM|nr:amino acid deaminase [Lysobacter penaei]MBB1086994.1 amino acid deaminase [Lysobacter penaei]